MTTRAEFANESTSVAAARRFVSMALDGVDLGLRQRAELMVSELATNSVKHARSVFVVTVEERDDTVRIEVKDAGSGAPTRRSPGPLEPSGRGLLIVEALADEWGVVEEAAGKAVWFCIASSGRQPTAQRS